jgi:hypothetical protein
MKKIFGVFNTLLITIFVLSAALTGCAQTEDPSGNAAAAKITVAGIDVTLPAPNERWWEADMGMVTIDSSLGPAAAIIVEPVETGSTVSYAKTAEYEEDPSFGSASTLAFESNDYLYVKVAASGGNVLYYFIKVKLAHGNFDVSSIMIHSKEASDMGEPASSAAEATAGAIAINRVEAADPAIEVILDDTEAGYRCAKATDASAPDFTAPVSSFADGDYLYVEVTSRYSAKMIYKLSVSVKNDINTLASITIGGEPVTPGTPNTTATSAVAVNKLYTTAQTNIQVSAVPSDAQYATVKYAKTTSQIAEPAYGTVSTFDFALGQSWVYVQVTAENGDVTNYRFMIGVGNDVKTLTGVTVAGVTATLGTPGAASAVAAPDRGSVSISSLTDAAIVATAADTTATVTWAPAVEFFGSLYPNGSYDTTSPVSFGPSGFFNYNLLSIQVTAQNGSVAYYLITVSQAE